MQGIYGGKVFPSEETIARVNADQKALESFDENAAKTQTQQIFQPLQSRYENALRSAGFKVV